MGVLTNRWLFPLDVSLHFGYAMFTNWLHWIFWDLFLHLWVRNVYQLIALHLLGRFLAFVGVVGVWVVVEMKRIRGSSRDRRSCNWDLLNVTFLRIRQ